MKKIQKLRNAVMVSLLAGTTVVWGAQCLQQRICRSSRLTIW
jgi:hypothetical protein